MAVVTNTARTAEITSKSLALIVPFMDISPIQNSRRIFQSHLNIQSAGKKYKRRRPRPGEQKCPPNFFVPFCGYFFLRASLGRACRLLSTLKQTTMQATLEDTANSEITTSH